jgi:hypothetical protein
MIEYIALAGISDELRDKMIDNLGYDSVLNLACNYELVKNNISLFRQLGIEDVDNLLLNKDYVFLKDTREIFNKFTNFNLNEIINLINNDYDAIDVVFM